MATKNLKKRVDYWEKIRDIPPEHLVFLDETGINLAMSITYGPSVKGNRVYDTRPDERGTNLTLIGAISLSDFQGIMTIDSGTSKNVFLVFIEQVLLPNLGDGACLVMDNLPPHKVKEIRDIIEGAGIKVVYLSPDSPEFNQALKIVGQRLKNTCQG